MSTLTKILVVVFVVLAIFASTVFIQLAVQNAHWKRSYDAEYRRAEAALAAAGMARHETTALQAERDATVQAKDKEIADLKVASGRLAEDNARAKLDLATRDTTVSNQQALATLMAQQNSGLLAQNKVQGDQLTERDKTIMALSKQVDGLEQDNRRLALDMERAGEQIKYFKEELAEKTQTIEDLQRGGSVAAATQGPTQGPAAAQSIQGTVQAVDVAHNLAQLNIGSAAGVSRGMRFAIYRGDGEFVAHLDVEDVGASNATGVLANVSKTPQQGDKAMRMARQ